jgi:uncharacterized membrane protein YkvA (DUF1232 family)
MLPDMSSLLPRDAGARGSSRLGRVLRQRGLTIVPFIGDLLAMSRLLWDRRASIGAKLLVLAAMIYVVVPTDAVPDVVPLLGFLDDVGVVVLLRLLMYRQLAKYRYPLFGSPPVDPDPLRPADPR